jgi:hypothetical protein
MAAWRLERSRRRASQRVTRAATGFRPRVEELESRLAPSIDMLTYHNGNFSHGARTREPQTFWEDFM